MASNETRSAEDVLEEDRARAWALLIRWFTLPEDKRDPTALKNAIADLMGEARAQEQKALAADPPADETRSVAQALHLCLELADALWLEDERRPESFDVLLDALRAAYQAEMSAALAQPPTDTPEPTPDPGVCYRDGCTERPPRGDLYCSTRCKYAGSATTPDPDPFADTPGVSAPAQEDMDGGGDVDRRAAGVVHDKLADITPCLHCWEATAVKGANEDPENCAWCDVIAAAIAEAREQGRADALAAVEPALAAAWATVKQMDDRYDVAEYPEIERLRAALQSLINTLPELNTDD